MQEEYELYLRSFLLSKGVPNVVELTLEELPLVAAHLDAPKRSLEQWLALVTPQVTEDEVEDHVNNELNRAAYYSIKNSKDLIDNGILKIEKAG